jgi:hypothetical protein
MKKTTLHGPAFAQARYRYALLRDNRRHRVRALVFYFLARRIGEKNGSDKLRSSAASERERSLTVRQKLIFKQEPIYTFKLQRSDRCLIHVLSRLPVHAALFWLSWQDRRRNWQTVRLAADSDRRSRKPDK